MGKRDDWHQENFDRLPNDIAWKAIIFLQSFLSEEDVIAIREDYQKDPSTWWASRHFSWGMMIRNKLRDNVCLDEKLPTLNWDDYYIILVEKACGLK